MIGYEPGESESGLFGGNSNWRGPVWFSLNFVFVQALEKLHRYLTESFTVTAPSLTGERITFEQAADLISEGLVNIFRKDSSGSRPVFPRASPFQTDPHLERPFLFLRVFSRGNGPGNWGQPSDRLDGACGELSEETV
jgi:hypothetical protein